MTVCIVDYGVCNLGSVKRAFEECGGDVRLCDNPVDLKHASHVVLPGVGAFADAMQALTERGWVPLLRECALERKLPFTGICLGMQLLATKGEEGGSHEGLNLIPGTVKKIIPADNTQRVPHVGGNEGHIVGNSPLLEGIADKSDFYFVHSYHFVPDNNEVYLLTTPYGIDMVTGISMGNISGFQFHPEKSGRSGFRLIKNFLEQPC